MTASPADNYRLEPSQHYAQAMALGFDQVQGDLPSAEQAASGEKSLKIVDTNDNTGSNVSSVRMPLPGAGPFRFRGKVFGVSGEFAPAVNLSSLDGGNGDDVLYGERSG